MTRGAEQSARNAMSYAIRTRLRRQTRLVWVWIVCAMLTAGVVEFGPYNRRILAWVKLALIIGTVVVVWITRRFTCPRCGQRYPSYFAYQAGALDVFRKAYGWVADHCPSCGMSLDEPYVLPPGR